MALGLSDFSGTVGGNISGTSDLAPLTEQADMILDLVPQVKTVGLLYCSAEPNSEYQVKVVEDYLSNKGITCTRYSFSDSNDVAAVTTKAAADSDVIYIPTDNTAASCTETIGSIVRSAKTPLWPASRVSRWLRHCHPLHQLLRSGLQDRRNGRSDPQGRGGYLPDAH